MGVAGPDWGKCKPVSAAHVTPGLSRETNTVQAEDDRKCVKTYKMGLTRCGNFLKYSMFLFNAVILIAGCGLLGFGVYTRTNDSRVARFSSIVGSYLYSTLSLLLIIRRRGGHPLVLPRLLRGHQRSPVHAGIVLLLAAAHADWLLGRRDPHLCLPESGDYVMKELYTSLNSSYGRADRKEVTETWDFMQKVVSIKLWFPQNSGTEAFHCTCVSRVSSFSCCGVYGDVNSSTSWAFYRTTLWFLNQTETSMKKYVPDSCCLSMMGDNLTRCVGGMGYEHIAPARGPPVYPAIENGIMFTEGCYSAFIAFLSDNIKVVGGVCVGVAVLMVLAMTFALCLCRRIKDDYLFD
ncbi:hypothetical protein C0Q70_15829 [Pomacea canaliculata]|uniref:Tetraspanin n=1 Tax=Pomacea canaliculata TaxID=400727 RepID=A0A2T7NVY0_POMCA|nr:hypothetical protein C0Q70_15829 [Pomacea canaliculata]